MNTLTQQQVAEWHDKGFLSPFPLLDQSELTECLDGLARFEKWLGGPVNSDAGLNWRTMPYLLMPWANKLARNPRILDYVEQLLGPDLLIFTSTFFIKEAHSPSIAAWHQDSTYYGLQPKEELCVWVALSEASEQAGCMECLSFNGQPRQLKHASRIVENSVNRGAQKIIETFDDSNPVAMPLHAGSFSMHHGLCLHRSGPNNSNHRRIGLGLNYLTPKVRAVGSNKLAAMLVRGKDRYGNFELVEPPKAEFDDEALATHARAVALYRQSYLEEEKRHALSA